VLLLALLLVRGLLLENVIAVKYGAVSERTNQLAHESCTARVARLECVVNPAESRH
jgi:hypothetical protein